LQMGWKDGWDGGTSCRFLVDSSGTDLYIKQTGLVSNYRKYRATLYAKVNNASGGPKIGIQGASALGSGSDATYRTESLTTEWEKYQVDFWGHSGGEFRIGNFDSGNADKILHIDGIELQEHPDDGQVMGGFLATIQEPGTGGFVAGDLTPVHSGTTLGLGDLSRPLGGALEVVPKSVKVKYQGAESPLLVSIKGGVSGDAVSTDVEQVRSKLEALERTVKSED